MNQTSTQAPHPQKSPSSEPPAHPENLGPYRLDELIGEYSGYAVFAATHRKKRQPVTLYLVPSVKGQGFQRFRKDIEAAAKIEHRSIASILDSGEIDGIPYVAYEPVDGISIQRLTKLEQTVPPPIACAIARQVAIGLHHIHEQGLLHKGVNPTNLMITRAGVVKILSLGVAGHTLEHPLRPGASENANYSATEHISGNAEVRSEIYSLGCTLFHMLTGETPESSLQRAKSKQELALNDQQLGPQLTAVLRAMMDLDAAKRIQQLTQVVGAMCNWASEENLPQLVADHMQETHPPKRPSPTINQEKAAASNPKNVEFTPPKSPGTRIGPAVAFVAIGLAIIYTGLWFLNVRRTQSQQTLGIQDNARTVGKDSQIQRTQLAIPTRKPSTVATATNAMEAVASEVPATKIRLNENAQSENGKPTTSDTNTTEKLLAKAPGDSEVPHHETTEVENAESQATVEHKLETLPTAIKVNDHTAADKSSDAYHNRLQKQLQEEYGLTNGRWVLTPNEFALISSVVSYGQKVTQDATTKDEDFARLVRMHIASKGSDPWSSGLYIPAVDGIEKGDRVLVVVWLRTSPGAVTEEGKVGIYVESANDHTKEVYLTVKPTPEWRQFLIPFQAKMEQQLRVGFHLAFQEQQIDYGGLTLINFGKTAPFWNAIPAGPKLRPNAK